MVYSLAFRRFLPFLPSGCSLSNYGAFTIRKGCGVRHRCIDCSFGCLLTIIYDRITGSSSGIGRQIAVESARQGANLVLHHIGDAVSMQDMQTLKTELSAIYAKQANCSRDSVRMVDIGLDVTEEDAGKR